jgi:hypothetical protein
MASELSPNVRFTPESEHCICTAANVRYVPLTTKVRRNKVATYFTLLFG